MNQQQQPQIKTKETEMTVVLVSWQCDKCITGELKPTGYTQNSVGGVVYLHHCGDCGHVAAALETYPKVTYKPKAPTAAPVSARDVLVRHTTRGKKR